MNELIEFLKLNSRNPLNQKKLEDLEKQIQEEKKMNEELKKKIDEINEIIKNRFNLTCNKVSLRLSS